MTGQRRYALAPMSRGILALTSLALAIPAAFVVMALAYGGGPPAWLSVILVGLYAWVWLRMRPREFLVSEQGLTIRWPLRARHVSRSEIAEVRLVEPAALRAELGFAARIGVGGLWGGFGWLWTRRRGLLSFYISRTDGFVLIEPRRGRPLLVTPENPRNFTEALGQGFSRSMSSASTQ